MKRTLLRISTAALAVTLLAPASAGATERLPADSLRSLSPPVVAQLVPGDELTIPFELAEPERIDFLEFDFVSPSGGDMLYLSVHRSGDLPMEQVLTELVQENWWPGSYRLEQIYLQDHTQEPWDSILYSRDGTTRRWGESEPATFTKHPSTSVITHSFTARVTAFGRTETVKAAPLI